MPALPRYVLYTSVLVALGAGCSTSGEVGDGGSGGSPGGHQGGSGGSTGTGGQVTSGTGGLQGGSGGSTGTGGVVTPGTGGRDVVATGGSATGGSATGGGRSGAGTGGGAVAGVGGHVTGGASGAGAGGTISTGGTGAGGMTATGGAGGTAPAPGCGNAAARKGAQNLTMQVAGKARTYLLFVPNGYNATKPIPLIFAWHSSGASGAESRKYYNLEPATGDGAIIVYPNGLNGGWDVSANGVDMKFFDQMLESISKDYCVDESRVFSTGYSFGGIMSNSLACDRGSKLRAFAPVEGAFFDGAKSCPAPVPAWIVHASNDPTVTYASGQAARDIWLKTNGCTTTTMPTTPSQCVAYQCTKAPVVWCVHTGGHIWPSFASKGVWAFFSGL